MQDKLIDIKNEALSQIIAAENSDTLESVRVEYLGKSKGQLTLIMKKLPGLPPEERAIVGRFANEVKNTIEDAIVSQQAMVQKTKVANINETEKIDVTMPGIRLPEGHIHPVSQALHDFLDIFKKLGYQVTQTHEIENDFYNFTSLNMGPDAPSRDTQACFHLNKEGSYVLQTQVTSMQVKILEKSKPPIRCVMPGKCFRVDDVDASHGFEFWQIDGFLIDKNIHMTDLLGTMDYVLRAMYGQDIKLRFDATYFAFVEPGVQAFISCTICKQKGCPFCKYTGWVELMPAGMIHPEVLKHAGLDPKVWGGFAFDLGMSRAAVLKNQIDDIRNLTNPDLRVLNQF